LCQSTKLAMHQKIVLVKRKLDSVKKHSGTPVQVTCEVNQKHNVTFEIDTGASCKILPFVEYVKATGDKKG